MIETDPASLEGEWILRTGDDEEGQCVELRDGAVIDAGAKIGAYVVEGAILRFVTRFRDEDGDEWTSAYRFGLGEHPDRLSGTMDIVEGSDFENGLAFSEACTLIRQPAQ